MFKFNKKAVATGLAAGLALGMSGLALAFWTSSGTGDGSATVANPTNADITIAGTTAPDLYPGESGTVSFTASNASAHAEQLSNIHLVSVATGNVNCLPADFTMADVAVPVSDGNIAGSAVNQVLATKGTLVMANTSVNQDACKGLTLTLTFSTS